MLVHETITLPNVIVQYTISFAENKEQNTLNLLNESFVGVCYRGGFVKSIVRIEDISPMRVVLARDAKVEGRIHVRFVAEMLYLVENDVLRDVVVTAIGVDRSLVGHKQDSPYIIVHVRYMDGLEVAAKDDVISIIVVSAMFMPNAKHVSVIARLYLPKVPWVVVRCKEVLKDTKMVDHLLTQLAQLPKTDKTSATVKGAVNIVDAIKKGADLTGYWLGPVDATHFVHIKKTPEPPFVPVEVAATMIVGQAYALSAGTTNPKYKKVYDHYAKQADTHNESLLRTIP